jgi:hypothetical protein
MDRQANSLRRALLFGGAVAATLPVAERARAASAPAAAPAPAAPRAEFAYEALVALAAEIPHGRTPYAVR